MVGVRRSLVPRASLCVQWASPTAAAALARLQAVQCVLVFTPSGNICLQMWRGGARLEGSLHTRKKVMAENIKATTAGGGAAQEQRYPAHTSGTLEWEDSKAVYKRFSEVYLLVLTDLHRKEWSALKFIDEFYDCMEGQLGQVSEASVKNNFQRVFSILEDCFRLEQGKSLPDVVAKDNKVMEQEAKKGDSSLCRVVKNNVKPQATVGRLLNFIVSTVGAGRGSLTAAVEEGVHGQPHPLKVEQLTETMFKVLFLPERSADYSVHIYFNRRDIDGSPFSFFCTERKSDALQCSVSGRGTSETLQGREEVFEVHTLASANSKLTALVQGEHCCVLPHIAPKGGGAYEGGYALPTAGEYQLSLLWDKEHIPGSPFSLQCRSPADPRDFLLDEGGPARTQPHQPYLFQAYLRSSACRSAEVEVEARGPRGEVVQGSVCMSSSHEDTFDAEFTPKVAGTWLVSMLADGQHVSGSPFKVKVVDPRQVTAWGAGLMDGVVGERGRFTIDTQGAGEGNLVVMVHGPKGGFKLSLRKDTVHRRRILASYQPMHAGAYKIDVLWSGTHVPGSPFKVVVAESTEEIQSEL